MEFYIKTLDFLERVMNGVMAIDPGLQPFISQDLEELNEMRDSLLKASGQAERSHEEKAALPLQSVTNRALLLKIKKLEADNKLLNFMVENGLGEEDMMNDITLPHEL